MFVLNVPAPVETFGLEYEPGDPTHLLMCFPTFDEAKAMQMRLFAEAGISGPIEERVFSKEVEA